MEKSQGRDESLLHAGRVPAPPASAYHPFPAGQWQWAIPFWLPGPKPSHLHRALPSDPASSRQTCHAKITRQTSQVTYLNPMKLAGHRCGGEGLMTHILVS